MLAAGNVNLFGRAVLHNCGFSWMSLYLFYCVTIYERTCLFSLYLFLQLEVVRTEYIFVIWSCIRIEGEVLRE